MKPPRLRQQQQQQHGWATVPRRQWGVAAMMLLGMMTTMIRNSDNSLPLCHVSSYYLSTVHDYTRYYYYYRRNSHHSNIIRGNSYNSRDRRFLSDVAFFLLGPQNLRRTNRIQLFQQVPPQPQPAEEENIDIETVSDTEALLACYAYLQRKNMLSEWSTSSKTPKNGSPSDRRGSMDNGQNLLQSGDDETMGFFWENLNELRYYNRMMNHNNVVHRQRIQHRNNETAASSSLSTILKTQNRNTTMVPHPILKSIEGTEYSYIENFVPGMVDDFDHSRVLSTDTDGDVVVAEVMATKMTTTELLLNQLSPESIESKSRSTVNNEQLPMYVNHPNNVWDIVEDDDIGIDDIDTPMYRKNYRNECKNDGNNYHQYDDETMEVLRFRRRSNRTKHLFHNATWKEAWYARRWGSDPDRSPSTHDSLTLRQQRRQQIKLNRLLQETSSNDGRRNSAGHSSSKTFPAFDTTPLMTQYEYEDVTSLLHSQFISRLEEDVIADAIVTYIRANRKRSMRRKFTNQHRKTFLLEKHYSIVTNSRQSGNDSNPTNSTTTTVSATSSSFPPQQSLHHYHAVDTKTITSEEDRQRQRREKAKRAYQTRLENEKRRHQQMNEVHLNTNPTRSLPLPYPTNVFESSGSLTPTAAYERIDCFISSVSNAATTISSTASTRTIPVLFWDNVDQLQLFQSDVELLLFPRTLSQRKELLLRIIRDLFQLRGRCIPIGEGAIGTSSSMDEYKFMTKASVPELGSFILQRINNRIIELCQ